MTSHARIGWANLVVLAAGWAVAAVPVAAEDVEFVSVTEFAALAERLEEVESRVTAVEHDGANCGQIADCEPCHCPGFTATAELLFLKLHDNRFYGPSAAAFDSYELAPRLSLGWTTASGLGIRARWFEYDVDTRWVQGDQWPYIYTDGWDIQTLDFEVTDTFQLGSKWTGLISGGLRYAECKEFYGMVAWYPYRFDGCRGFTSSLGPVAGLEMQRRLTEHLSLFGLVRGSLLFDDWTSHRIDRDTDSGAVLYEENYVRKSQMFGVTEVQLGGQWQRPLNRGASLFVRAAAEGQFWISCVDSSGDERGESSLGLAGGLLAIGIDR